MATSPLDLINIENFLTRLTKRNLQPYSKSPSKFTPPINFEYSQSDYSVIDSPDQLIDEPSLANKLFPLNQYGNDGGYRQAPDPNGLLNSKSNEGEYGYQDANIVDESFIASDKGIGNISPAWKPLNAYAGVGQGLDAANAIGTFNSVTPDQDRQGNGQPYSNNFNPSLFVPSSYSPVSILLFKDPQGSDGLLSQDSYIARMGAENLRKDFQARIAAQILQDTIGRANIFNVRSGTDILSLVTGRVPLIEPNYKITISSNPILAASDFALRLAGSILPVSTIPGSYFDPSINPGQPTTIQQLQNAYRQSTVGKLLTGLLGANTTGSQLFYNNLGSGQKSRLFGNIDFNKYKPSFDRTLFDRLGGAIVGSTTNNSDYYVGSITSDPSRVFSPSGDLPVNTFGQEQQMPVYGPQELAQLYEGPSQEVRLGANGPTYSDGGGIEGGFTWVSPKYKDNAGKKVGLGGAIFNQDEDFKPSSYNSTESTNRVYREGSILDDTQRIIDSQPQGGKRLQHVGNAIDQVSKVFHDGYKEITKGSRVLSYVGSIGQEVGTEYCRVFAKDTPYLQFNDLQKTDGITTQGRRFSYSVLDNTYNLNIVPNKQEGGQDSTNLIGNENNGYAKKYMFSIENLAWATSNAPGYAVADLPVCERGPNGGRVMWFPPYGLTFTESVSANWNPVEFLGRPEPIYTYKNTSRTGTLTWKIVVDHPSALNVIVNKVLNNETNKVRIDSILESFFAGCRKYDLYELAKKYYTIKQNDLFQIQQAITSKELSQESLEYAVNTVGNVPAVAQGAITAAEANTKINGYKDLGFYFDNDVPAQLGVNYIDTYAPYISQEGSYGPNSTVIAQTTNFFQTVIKPNKDKIQNFINELKTQMSNYPGTVTISLAGSASAPAKKEYNQKLSKRRIDSAITYMTADTKIQEFVQLKRLLFIEKPLGENAQVQKFDAKSKKFMSGTKVNCTDNDSDSLSKTQKIYSTNSMACRRAFISDIQSKLDEPPSQAQQAKTNVTVGNVVTKTVTQPVLEQKVVIRDNISKRVLRSLLSECDYFETIKEETPMVYDNLKEKLKFFQPAFHSMTPEGLNSRLTFLQQCMRPGDTIPTVKSVGGKDVLEYNNATNTSFGAPPVLILRIGDFYNTKIIPTSLNFTYENLDINPEGIGVQPMIANVTMGFNFVGGSGLKESVDKLQNALTFNYYANTEIYDDRATPTDDSYKIIDKQFLDANRNIPAPTLNDALPNQGQTNESTVGTILTTVNIGDIVSGTTSYQTFMDDLITNTQTYFTNVVNKNKECVNQYNNALRQQWMLERTYTEGQFNVYIDANIQKVPLFGKPYNVEKRIDEIFSDLIADVKGGDEGFIQILNGGKFNDEKKKTYKNIPNKIIRQVKDNYVKFLQDKKGVYQNPVTIITQGIVNVEQIYIPNLSRINTITYQVPAFTNTGTDGFAKKNGQITTYITSGTSEVDTNSGVSTTLEELIKDVKIIGENIYAFNSATTIDTKIVWTDGKPYSGPLVFPEGTKIKTKDVFNPFQTDVFTNDKLSLRRVYMLMSNDVIDLKKQETFKNALIGNVIINPDLIEFRTDLEDAFKNYWEDQTKPNFVSENKITEAIIDKKEKEELVRFLKFDPYTKGKKRVFTYTTENADSDNQITLIKGLGQFGNLNTDAKTWNDEISPSTWVSKVKLL
jgi:outer membrane protein OmpA-like peptidoglycan-associated protein